MTNKLRVTYLRKTTILLALTPAGCDILSTQLGKEYKLFVCQTMTEAQMTLDQFGEQIDLIIGGIQFDKARMYEFLQYAKRHETGKNIPFISVKTSGSVLDEHEDTPVFESLEVAAKAFGAAGLNRF